MTDVQLKIPEGAAEILRKLNDSGCEAYVVGGCVRDALLGKTPHDWDICTSAKPEAVIEIFSPERRVIETGIKHGTVTVLMSDGAYEITTFRVDGTYSDNRHPDSVSFTSSLEEDLARRDFTMNAIAYSETGGFFDPYHGGEDLMLGLIRCVGEPERRFREDGLRIMRAVRFASTYRFAVEPETEDALFQLAPLLNHVSFERLRDELCKLLMGDGVEDALLRYREIIVRILPEIEPMFDCPQNNPWHCYDVYRHTAVSVASARRDRILRLAMFFHDVGKPACRTTNEEGIDHFYGHPVVSGDIAEQAMRRLRFDNETREAVVQLIQFHDADLALHVRSVRRMLSKLGPMQFSRLLDVQSADASAQSEEKRTEKLEKIRRLRCLGARILTEKAPLSLKNLAVNGDDLITLGMMPGPEMGKLLQKLMELVLDEPEKNERETLLRIARETGFREPNGKT